MTNDEIAEMIAERNGNQRFCKNCDDCCQPYNSTDDCFKSAMQAMEWKDKQHKQEKQQWIDNSCEWIEQLMVASDNYDAYDIQENLKDFKKSMKGE